MKKVTTTLLLGSLVLTGCTSAKVRSEERERQMQIQMQEPADNGDQLMRRAAMAFSNSPGLNPEQKLRLNEIYTKVYIAASRIRREMGKTKSLLFMTLAKVDYRSAEITDLKSRIVSLDQERLTLMFKALDDVQAVVGKGIEAEKIYRHLEYYEVPGRMRDYDIQ